MTWQEYQESVGLMYKKMNDIGEIMTNLYLPDKVTGQKRQIDVWWKIELGEHKFGILIDAKFRSTPLDVRNRFKTCLS